MMNQWGELQLQRETITPGTDQTTRAEHSCFTSEWSARPSPERCSLRSGRRRRSGCELSRRWTLQNPWTLKNKRQSESLCWSQSCDAATVSHISPKKSHSEYFHLWSADPVIWGETSLTVWDHCTAVLWFWTIGSTEDILKKLVCLTYDSLRHGPVWTRITQVLICGRISCRSDLCCINVVWWNYSTVLSTVTIWLDLWPPAFSQFILQPKRT